MAISPRSLIWCIWPRTFGDYIRLSVVENLFVYLMIFSIGLNISWIIAEEWKLIEITKDGISYTGYLLYRTFALPLIYVIWMNVVFKLGKAVAVFVSAGIVIVVILSLNGLMLYHGAFVYKQWNLLYDTVLIVVLQVVGYGLLHLFRKSVIHEVSPS